MVLKSVSAPHLGPGGKVKFGRQRPIAHGPRPRLGNYLKASLPPGPPSVDYSPRGQPALSNIYGNDRLGDCVIAGAYHIVATETGNAGQLFTATPEQIIADYRVIGGYDPDDPSTDQGCDEPTALNYWLQHGFADGTKPLGWLSVDATNRAELQSAMYLFENLYFGVELPDSWINPIPNGNGFVWDVAGDPVPENGHCVVGVGYTPQGVTIDTWGLLGTVTWAALAQYFVPSVYGAAYVLLTPDQLEKGRGVAPNGVAWSALLADFDAIGGSVPIGAPTFDLMTVRGIQQALNYLGADPALATDGIAGRRTRAAIEAFQRAHGLAVDGVAGRFTRAALQLALKDAG
jgi:hypothetical protein